MIFSQVVRRFLLCCLSLFLGCGDGKDPDKGIPPESPPVPRNGAVPPATALQCPAGSALSYENFGEAFFANYCLGCHSSGFSEENRAGSPIKINFDNLEEIQIWRRNIFVVVSGDAPTMPPGVRLSALERTQLVEWISCGAPR
jgi:uncharacterized membrane protein